jgi:hypothetical protein
MDSKDELLIILLQCGYADIDTLIGVMEMGDELFGENLLYDVIDEHGSEALCSFNGLMYYLMEEIVYRLVAELDEEIGNEDDKYRCILDEYWSYPYTNYMDREKLLSNLKDELDEMKNKGKR